MREVLGLFAVFCSFFVCCLSAEEEVAEWFSQKTDHFNPYNFNTFQQKWYHIDTYWSGAENKGPFLFIAGGEGTLTGIMWYLCPLLFFFIQKHTKKNKIKKIK